MTTVTYKEITFSDDDVVNPNDYDAYHGMHTYLLHDHGFPLAIVHAQNLQDALDETVDQSDKLDQFEIFEKELQDYNKDQQETFASLGNAGKLFDIDNIDILELPHPKRLSYVETIREMIQAWSRT